MPIEPLQVVEILERSEQGVTRPFLCRCDDDPIRIAYPPVEHQHVSLQLHGHGAKMRHRQLLRMRHNPRPKGRLRAKLSAFREKLDQRLRRLHDGEWRYRQAKLQRQMSSQPLAQKAASASTTALHVELTSLSGNPNLLWDADAKQLVVIDHNVAFDHDFSILAFSETHVFHQEVPKVFQDLVERLSYAKRLHAALAAWPAACQNVPDEWWFADEERTVPADFDPDAVLASLNRCTHEGFWRLAP